MMCVWFFKNIILHGVSECYGKNIDQMTTENNNKAYGGGHTYLNDCSLSELQAVYKDIVIDDNFCRSYASL